MNEIKKRLITTALEAAINKKEIAGANMLILDKGKESYYTQIGLANIEANQEIKRDTIFRLYSMTKPVTAAATMILMERGLIDLMDPVKDYIPAFKDQRVYENGELVPVNRDIKIKELLNMTSGLVYPGFDGAYKYTDDIFKEVDDRLFSDKPMTTYELAEKLGKTPLLFQPNSSWKYGTSADVLGAVIEVVAGKSLAEFMKDELFEPLGMKDTDFYVPEEKQNRLATTYETVYGEENALVLYKGHNLGINNNMDSVPAFQSGGAGLASTIDDYSKFATMLINGGSYNGKYILSPKTVEFLTTQVLEDYQTPGFDIDTMIGHSYGNLMRICNRPDLGSGILSIGEYGWDGWLGCYFANLPNEEKTILIMMQKKDAGTTPLARKLRNIILS